MEYKDFYERALGECSTTKDLINKYKHEINHPKLAELKDYIEIQFGNLDMLKEALKVQDLSRTATEKKTNGYLIERLVKKVETTEKKIESLFDVVTYVKADRKEYYKEYYKTHRREIAERHHKKLKKYQKIKGKKKYTMDKEARREYALLHLEETAIRTKMKSFLLGGISKDSKKRFFKCLKRFLEKQNDNSVMAAMCAEVV